MQFEYGLEQRVPHLKNVLFGIQWAALLVSTVIILGKVIGDIHFNESSHQITYLQKLLFMSSVTLFCQILWGHKLPIIPGPSAILLVGVLAGRGFGLDTIYSSVVIGGVLITILAFSGLVRAVQKLFTPSVVAVVLLLIAFSLAPTIEDLVIDNEGGTHHLIHIFFFLVMIFLMFVSYRFLEGIWKSTLIIWAMIFGSLFYILIIPTGPSAPVVAELPWFSGFFRQMNVHFSIQPGVLISFLVCFIALSINDIGSIQSVNEMLKPQDTAQRTTRGMSITGITNIVSGFFGVIGPVNYSISPGMIAATGCASRFPLIPTVIIVFMLSFFPAAIEIIGNVPPVVIGAVLTYILSTQVASGLTVVFREGEKGFRFENGMVIGLSMLLCTVVAYLPPHIIHSFPSYLRPVLGNGFVVGVVGALILEQIFPSSR